MKTLEDKYEELEVRESKWKELYEAMKELISKNFSIAFDVVERLKVLYKKISELEKELNLNT